MTRATPIRDVITIQVPFRVVKRGGRKEMQMPEGATQPQRTDKTLVKALARAFRWKRMLESGEFPTDGVTEADARTALMQLDPLWDELFPAEQARIVALLVERVDISTDGLNVRLRIDGLSGLAREMLSGGVGEAA